MSETELKILAEVQRLPLVPEPYKEVAEKLGMNEKKVKSYLQNGKRNLKICLEGKHVQ